MTELWAFGIDGVRRVRRTRRDRRSNDHVAYGIALPIRGWARVDRRRITLISSSAFDVPRQVIALYEYEFPKHKVIVYRGGGLSEKV